MTKKPFIIALIAGASLTQFHLTASARGASNAPGKYEDWHDLDHVQIMQTFSLANYTSIVVASVSSKGAQLPPSEDNSYRPVMDALSHVTATFAEGMSEEAPRGLTVSQGSTAGIGALLIRARVTAVHPGSEAARHFGGIAGLAGGAASVAISGEVVDGKTRKVLFTFEQERRSGANSGGIFGLGAKGDNNPYARLVNRSAKQIGNDVASALKAF